MKNNKLHTAILGGGAAGLAVAYHAKKAGKSFTVFEAEDRVGGICKTNSFQDFLYDLGAHRFHDKDSDVTEEIKQLMGNRLHVIDLPSQIFLNNKLIDFPLSPMNLLKNLGFKEIVKSGKEWIKSRLTNRTEFFENFEQYAVYKYGKTIADKFLLNYSQKLWGLPCKELSTDISGERLKGLCLTSFILEALTASKAKTAHLDGKFYYPKNGFGDIINELVKQIGHENIQQKSRITKIHHKENYITSIEINSEKTYQADHFVNTLPLTNLLQILDPPCPVNIQSLAGELKYRSVILFVLFLNCQPITRSGTVYFPDLDIPWTRISEPLNRSPFMTPEGKTSLLIEIPWDQHKPVTQQVKSGLLDTIVQKLHTMGWIKPDQIINTKIEILNYAYPLLDLHHHQKLEKIHAWLDQFPNLTLNGRSSLFKYSHFHDMMALGKTIAQNL